MKLRPVTFTYKSDRQGVKQYGLVAEEVDRIYPELVVRDEAGEVESVRYSMLTSMLLNELQSQSRELRIKSDELQKQTAENRHQADQIDRLSAQVAEQRTAFERRLATLEQKLEARSRNEVDALNQ
jgi:FtsZ-binding cell division protein ZapB